VNVSIPDLLAAMVVPGLPALVALVAWSEGAHRVARQFGARMLWEAAAAVAVGFGFLLYYTMPLVDDGAANIAAIAVASASAVSIVTAAGQRLRPASAALRLALSVSASVVGLVAGALAGIGVASVVWPTG
jgi:TRAP-type C4-dicarboxylate transport system permease large subunit